MRAVASTTVTPGRGSGSLRTPTRSNQERLRTRDTPVFGKTEALIGQHAAGDGSHVLICALDSTMMRALPRLDTADLGTASGIAETETWIDAAVSMAVSATAVRASVDLRTTSPAPLTE